MAEVGPLWHEQHQARLTTRPRRRAAGAGAKRRFVFVDRLLATLASLRHGTIHDVLACWFGVDRSTIARHRRGAASARAAGCAGRPAASSRRGRRVPGHPTVGPGSSTARRSGCAARRHAARTGGNSSPGRPSRTR
ncbi:transposase family protein [Streptomyces sp. NBC_00647]